MIAPRREADRRVIALNKPCGVVCQFSGDGQRATLADFVPVADVYPAGRLDRDSEGLVVLTDDGRLQHRITHPARKLAKTYWVQVEREPDAEALARLRHGIRLRDGWSRPAAVRRLAPAAWLWPREPPVRYRARVATAWLEIVLQEGRNRQIRRMTAAVGHPTLRLVRYAIGNLTVERMEPGSWRELDPTELARLLADTPPQPLRAPAARH